MDGVRDWDREPISSLCLAFRASWCLEVTRIATVGELCRQSAADLLAIRHFGETTLAEVRERLAEHGLALRGEERSEIGPDIVTEAPPSAAPERRGM